MAMSHDTINFAHAYLLWQSMTQSRSLNYRKFLYTTVYSISRQSIDIDVYDNTHTYYYNYAHRSADCYVL